MRQFIVQTARAVPAATVVNLRDLGGIALGRDRRLRQGILLRSGQLSDFDAESDMAVAALGIRTVVDLRTADERQWAPDRLPPGARLFVADVLGDNPGVAPARIRALLGDPDGAASVLGDGKAEELFAQTYRKMVLSPGARPPTAPSWRQPRIRVRDRCCSTARPARTGPAGPPRSCCSWRARRVKSSGRSSWP